jgi:glycosyltransferase involved in cell wall biosynthesis
MKSDKPNLLIVSDTYHPKIDGVLMFVEEFLKKSQNDFEISWIVPGHHRKSKFSQVKTIFLTMSKKFSAFTYQPIEYSRDNRKKIKKAVKNSQIVFIQVFGPIGILAFRYARKMKKKIVVYVHNTPWEFLEKHYSLRKITARMARRFFISMYNKADLLLVPFHDMIDELKQEGIKSKMEVARLGVDIDRFSPPKDKDYYRRKVNLPVKTKIITYVGRVSNEKNTLILLEAFLMLRGEVFLLIVGDGQKELVEKFKEHKNCKVTGFVNNVQDYLKASDIFVMPSLTETTSLATLEAMATGLPVVATKVGFIKKYLIKNHNGIFFPRNSSTHLALKLEKVLQEPEFAIKIGKNARKTVAYAFSWERSINKIKRILKRFA